MATVYLLVMHRIDLGDGVDEITTDVRNRAFVSAEVREAAARRFIDDLLAHFDVKHIAPHHVDEVQDHIDDMLYARRQGDLSYELMCCRDIFGLELELQDVVMELEELIGEVLN